MNNKIVVLLLCIGAASYVGYRSTVSEPAVSVQTADIPRATSKPLLSIAEPSGQYLVPARSIASVDVSSSALIESMDEPTRELQIEEHAENQVRKGIINADEKASFIQYLRTVSDSQSAQNQEGYY